MKYLFPILPLLLTLSHCRAQEKAVSTYPEQVGDIAFDAATDKQDFYLCNPAKIYQYYNFGTTYHGEKNRLKSQVMQQFVYQEAFAPVNGRVVIRFVVNCKGETDRFRVQEIDMNYQPAHFPPALVQHLLQITRRLDGWAPGQREGVDIDSYVFLHFIIKNGQLTDVAP